MSFMLLSLYKMQQARLADLAAERENTRALTIMGAQGKQADVVILSLVRSNTDEAPGVALGSIRRDRDLNVALSRARRLLVLVGDLSHFERFGDRSGRIADLITVFRESPTEQDSRGAAIAPLDGLVEPGWLPE
jgi:superfamily I DNA and/or RNA helicase